MRLAPLAAVLAIIWQGPSFADTLADALDGLAKVNYGATSPIAIGDSIDALDPSTPKDRCVESGQVKADTSGAINSQISFKFIRDFESFDNTFKISWNVEATANANIAKIANGDSTLKNFGSFENFLKQERESVLILIDASAEHGREIFENFTLKEQYQKLITQKNFSEFRKRCGTHFVRGWNRYSSVSIVIQISNLNKEAKLTLENTMTAINNVTVSLADAVTAGAKSTITSTLSDTLNLASKLGSVSARVESVGGAGIGTISAIVSGSNLADPSTLANLLTNIAAVGKDFTFSNSSPRQFITVPYNGLSDTEIQFDGDRYKQLGTIYKTLVRVDQRLLQYENYKTKDYPLWNIYFRVDTEKVKDARDKLAKNYASCRSRGECDTNVPAGLDGLLLDDVLQPDSFEIRCIHSNEYTDTINGSIAEKFRYLSSLAFVWKGQVNFLKTIDLDSIEILMITPDFKFSKTSYDPHARQVLSPNAEGNNGHLLMDVYRAVIDRGLVEVGGKIKVDSIRDQRAFWAQTVFIARLKTLNGFTIDETLGRGEIKTCPTYVSSAP